MKTKNKSFSNANINAVIFALFLLSGLLKSFTALIGGLPVDITLVLAVILTVMWVTSGRESLNIHQAGFIPLCIFIAFTLIIFLSLTYSESSFYGYIKAALWFTCILAFLFPTFNRINIKLFVFTMIFSTLILSIVYSVMFGLVTDLGLDERAKYVFSGIYLELAYFIGISIYLLFILFSNKSLLGVERKGKTLVSSITSIVLFLYLFYSLINTGARGPLIFFIVTMFLYVAAFKLPLGIRLTKAKAIFYLVLSLSLAFVFLIFTVQDDTLSSDSVKLSSQSSRAVDRIALLFNEDKGNSVNTRIKYLEDSTHYINERVIQGYGFGSYGVVTTGVDQKAFPHNILLESWFELGLLGFITILAFIINALFSARKEPLLVFFLLFLVFNQMKSSNLPDSRVFFGMIAISLLIVNLNQRRTQTH